MKSTLPIPILLTTYNRVDLLKKTINFLNQRTFYPYRIFVGDNGSSDETKNYLKHCKVTGEIFDYYFSDTNLGQCKLLEQLFLLMEDYEINRRRPHNKYFVTTQDDLYAPDLGQFCWLSRMVDILQRHEPEYSGICARIERTPRTNIDETTEIIPGYKNFPSVGRLLIRDDFKKMDDNRFGVLKKWESNIMGETFKLKLHKKFGFATHIYFSHHDGFMQENKGYDKNIDTFTVAANKLNERLEKKYPEINEKNEPIKINHGSDFHEQKKRDDYQRIMVALRKALEKSVKDSGNKDEGFNVLEKYLNNF